MLMAIEALRFLRPLVKAGSLVAPRMTGHMMFRLFCTPPSLKGLDAAQREMIARAESRLAHGERFTLPFEGGALWCYRFRPETADTRGTVLLLHGWTGRAAFMSAFVQPLVNAGFEVVALDLPAHGSSSGKQLHVPLGVAALHALLAITGPWRGIIAHSFGGAIATSLVAGTIKGLPAVPLERLVLIATPGSIPELFAHFGRTIGLSARAQHYFDGRVLHLAKRPLADFVGRDLLRAAGVKTLVMHAPDDKEVDYSHAVAMAEAGDHITLVTMPGLGHRRILYATATVKQALAFVEG
jgi:pimeloyl-ACP methyl ester carboxylesterase